MLAAVNPGAVDVQPQSAQDVTRILERLGAGHPSAADELFPLVYDQLRSLAAVYFRGRDAGHTLQPTALVHEAYVKLVGDAAGRPRDRAHFFALAARVMRQILVDHARSKQREKRGGGQRRLTLDGALLASAAPGLDLVELDDSLKRLSDVDESYARIVELRFFAGLSEDEASEALGVSRPTAARAWRFARAWLLRELCPEPAP